MCYGIVIDKRLNVYKRNYILVEIRRVDDGKAFFNKVYYFFLC